ncbi:MAG: hypothetical protein ACK5Q5_09680, partial [Planctomycetaceae bacterium]
SSSDMMRLISGESGSTTAAAGGVRTSQLIPLAAAGSININDRARLLGALPDANFEYEISNYDLAPAQRANFLNPNELRVTMPTRFGFRDSVFRLFVFPLAVQISRTVI